MRPTLLIIVMIALSVMASCDRGQQSATASAATGDSTLCQFSNLKLNRMYYCIGEGGDTLYFDNTITALWPQVINGKSCDALQQALLRAMTDSAGLNTLDKAADFLLNPGNYSEYASSDLVPVDHVVANDGKLSTSEVRINMESMTDRLLTYHLGTYAYMAGGAHGIYGNNYVTYDLKTGKAVSLSDIIGDTTLLRQVTLTSIKREYDYDKSDLLLPDDGVLPLPGDFFIQDHVLHVVYQVYEIASYAQGMIVAPIHPYLLKPEEMKRLFTDYGHELTAKYYE